MSRLPLENVRSGVFAAEPGDFRYGWIGATVKGPDVVFPFYSVHITSDLEGPRGDQRVTQVEKLIGLVGSESPLVVAGDFNAHPQHRPMQIMRRSLADLGDAANLGAISTWPAGKPNERIDYVFGRGVTPAGGHIMQTTASDHLPVLVRIQTKRMDATGAAAPASNGRSSNQGQHP
jgi:endonuclease/exonuclease/phosphatase family metal-dependent hydrolase